MNGREQALVRARLALALGLAFMMVALTAVVLARSRQGDDSTPVADANLQTSGYAGSQLPDGFRVPDFSLSDQEGKTVSKQDLRGKPSLLTFTYSNCEESCPTQVQVIKGAMDELGREVPAFAISVDPAGDTRMSATRFLAKQRVLGRVDFLLGSRRQLAPVWKGFGIQPQTKNQDHHARIVLADGNGFQRVGYSASDVTPKQLAADYKRLERADGS